MVKRLRHRPFTAVTRVRFPMGSPCIMPAVYFTAGIYAETPASVFATDAGVLSYM